MTNDEIYTSLRHDIKDSPYHVKRESVHGYYTESWPVQFNFIKRDSGYYLKVKLHTWPSEHEKEHVKFRAWLVEMTAKYGWKPHLTSGGVGNYTYRLNSDLNLDWY